MVAHKSGYNEILLEAVKARLPGKISPVAFVMDVLCIGKEAAYRRLRGEVPLSFGEAVLLANKLGFSLHEIITSNPGKKHFFSTFLVDFETPGEDDYKAMQDYLNNISLARDDPDSQLAITTNTFPMQLYLRYKNLTKFFLFKWIYMDGQRQAKVFHEIKITERIQQFFQDFRESHLQFTTTYYIFDRQLSLRLANDLRYFTSAGLLRSEDSETIRREAYKLLDHMEQVAINGKYENGNDVYMYVSDINFNKSFYNMRTGGYHACVIETCVLNGLVSTGRDCYRRTNDWVQSRRRLSTLITQSAEPQRIAFFNSQRGILESL